jgi:hypothetical protein
MYEDKAILHDIKIRCKKEGDISLPREVFILYD